MATSAIANLLVVDRDCELTTTLCELLRQQGCDAACYNSADSALAALREERFDLLLAEMAMPEMDGITLLREGLRIDPHLVGIIMTNEGTIRAAVDAMKAGAFDCLLKPVQLEALEPVLTEALEFRRLRMQEAQSRNTPLRGLGGTRNGREHPLAGVRERKETEDALLESEHKYRMVLENIDELVYAVRITRSDPFAGAVQFVSGRVKQILGYDPDDFIADARLWFRSIHPDDLAGLIESTQRILAEGTPATRNYRIRLKNSDEYRWMEDKIALRDEGDGETVFQFGVARDVTARRQAEETLSKLSRAVEQTADNVFITGVDGRIEYVNPAFETLTGYSASEAIGETPRILKSGRHSQKFYERMWESILSGRVFRAELINRKRSGDLYYEEKTITPIRDGLGNITHFVSTGKDVTERKMADLALTESESKFRTLAESTSSSIVILQGDRLVYANPAAEKISGYSQEELFKLNFWALVHPEMQDEVRQRGFARQRGEIPPPMREVRIVNRSGEERRLDFTAVTIEINGKPAVLATSFDITERKRAEEALRASEERYRELVENAYDIVYTHDLKGRFTSINKAGETITGYVREEALKLSISEVVAPEYRETVERMMKTKINRPGPTAYELVIISKAGQRIPLEVGTRLIYEDGRPVGGQGIARDLTTRKELEEQLRQSQKMEAIGRLAGGIAHDFNNLLTAILGYSQLALELARTGKPATKQVEEVQKAGLRAADLTKQLLAFSRKQVLQPKVISLNDVIEELQEMISRLIGEDIEFITSLEQNLALIYADPPQIQQVIMNLAVNARDAMPGGGKLILETSNVHIDEEYASHLAGAKLGPHVMLAVIDTGSGMDKETQARIFDPFFTTKGAGKGTGLGLSTVYGIVAQSGGNIQVHSEPGHGTTFRVCFPATEEEPVAAGHGEDTVIVRGTETVLVVEDDPVVRSLTVTILLDQGYTVLEAASGNEALDLVEKYSAPVHVLLTDVVMPQMSGKELADKVNSVRPGIRTLFVSGYPDDTIVHHGVLAAGVALLEKPFTPKSLALKLRQVLDARAGE
ncbi:MAG TPA: PAS domain S-box protein [Blastocatellia bacterium]|nr:PAS domain S-box protein [Blastocatellia bacterium]